MLAKILLCGISEIFLPMFSTGTFIVSWLIFTSFIHFEFTVVQVGDGVSGFCIYLSRSPSTICWRGCFYSILCFFPLCQILIGDRDLGLFLDSVFCSLGLCVCYVSTRLFCLQWPCSTVRYQVCDPSNYILLSQDGWGYSESFLAPYKFLEYLV